MIDKYDGMDFVTISNGIITWQGYFYDEGQWHRVEYTKFSMTISDFITKYHSEPDTAYDMLGASCSTQYIHDYDDDEEAEKDFMEWFKGATPINSKDISEATPDGDYILTGGYCK